MKKNTKTLLANILMVFVMPIITGVLIGSLINHIFDKYESYENSTVSIVSQRYVAPKDSYAYIVSLTTRNEYKYKRSVRTTEIWLSDDTTQSVDDGDENDVTLDNPNIADKELMSNLFNDIFESKFNQKIKIFRVGTKVQTKHVPGHYEINYTSSWSKKKEAFGSVIPISHKKEKMSYIRKFRVDNSYQSQYYTY